jgi:hypothetical protein
MVYAVIRSVQAALKYRGGWKGLFEHMYTVSFSLAWRRFAALCFVWFGWNDELVRIFAIAESKFLFALSLLVLE